MADIIALAESLVHPALVSAAHILVAILLVSRVVMGIVVVVARILFSIALDILLITGATLVFLSALTFSSVSEVDALFPELLLIHLLIFLYVEFPFVF